MAFKDLSVLLYEGKIKLDYKDKAHRYYAYPRIDFAKDPNDRSAWGKQLYPKGTTTLLEDTLEKKGLMTWPMGMALGELFGFYDFTDEKGERRTGFSKEKLVNDKEQLAETGRLKGTMWGPDGKTIFPFTHEEMSAIALSASKASTKRKKKGADIGSVVHDAIEHFINANPNLSLPVPVLNKRGEPVLGEGGNPLTELPTISPSNFDIAEQYMWNMKESEYETEADRLEALQNFPEHSAMAEAGFGAFVAWWGQTKPVLYGAEQLLYSMENNVCGTYDGDIGIQARYHPVFKDLGQKIIRVTADWKTSNASKSPTAAMWEGVNYQYFHQSAIYELMRREMGMEPADDLLIVSCRKDGGFSLVYASELGLTVGDCIKAAEAVIFAYRFKEKAINGLKAHAGVK